MGEDDLYVNPILDTRILCKKEKNQKISLKKKYIYIFSFNFRCFELFIQNFFVVVFFGLL